MKHKEAVYNLSVLAGYILLLVLLVDWANSDAPLPGWVRWLSFPLLGLLVLAAAAVLRVAWRSTRQYPGIFSATAYAIAAVINGIVLFWRHEYIRFDLDDYVFFVVMLPAVAGFGIYVFGREHGRREQEEKQEGYIKELRALAAPAIEQARQKILEREGIL